jgi:hypothetical protein
MTVAFPLTHCGIEPLPERYGFGPHHTSSIASSKHEGASSQIPITGDDEPFFGNMDGNFQPSRDVSDLATGGQVSNPKVAVTSINNKDGIGAGKDSYKLYLGDGSSFPKQSQWASFEDL